MKDMLGREEILSVENARELLLNALSPVLPQELDTDIDNTLHRILSRDIISPENLPGFARSTMDGFAVNSSDTFGAKEGSPAYLNVIAEIQMGENNFLDVRNGETAKIATGGMIPEGADAVIMFEHTNEISKNMLEVFKSVAPGENIIQTGEDCKKDQKILVRGHRIRPQDIGALAGLGVIKSWIYDKPTVAIIATGDEIVPASSPVTKGQVRDINSHSLAGLIDLHGGIAIQKGIFKDTYEVLQSAVNTSIQEADMVTITGGSSVGTKDLTEKIINSTGKPGVLFLGVSVKPGKPLIGGVVNGKPVFGLPGHPAAIIVCFELFIKPVLRLLTGEIDKLNHSIKRTVTAKLSKNISSSAGREDHVRVKLAKKENVLWAVPVLGKSGLITTLVQADGTIVIPHQKPGLEQGTEVEVELF